MLTHLLAQATPRVEAAPPVNLQTIDDIHRAVVQRMPWGGLSLMFVLIALGLVVGLWIVWSQRRLASNQVRIAELIERHLAEHEHK